MALAVMPPDERQGSESDFKPNLVNSVCYLVQQGVQLATFGVNYVGHPFNTGARAHMGGAACARQGRQQAACGRLRALTGECARVTRC